MCDSPTMVLTQNTVQEALNAKVQWESKTKDDRFVMYSSIVVGDCQIIAWDSPETIRAGTQAPTSMFR